MDLLTALKRKALNRARDLIQKGADPELTRPENDEFPLMIAAERGYTEIVRLLIEQGANIDRHGKGGKTAFSQACFFGHLEIAKLLVNAGAKIQVRDQFGATPLFWAVCAGHYAVVEWLLNQGANFLACNDSGESPLLRVVSGVYHPSSEAILALFLAQGADPNYTGPWKMSLLMRAAQGGHLGITQRLLAAGALPELRNQSGETALVLACKGYSDQAELVQALIEAGSNLNERDRYQFGLLALAAQNGHLEILKTLLKAGADPNGLSVAGFSPLMAAICSGHPELAEYLLQAGALPEKKNQTPTPLMEALSRRQYALARRLIERGANLSARDQYGTVLLYALGVQDGYLYERAAPPKISTAFLEELLDAGASLEGVGANLPEEIAQHKRGLKTLAQKIRRMRKKQTTAVVEKVRTGQ